MVWGAILWGLVQVPRAAELTLENVLEAMQGDMQDVWEDARMPDVCSYLYGNKMCAVSRRMKPFLPAWL